MSDGKKGSKGKQPQLVAIDVLRKKKDLDPAIYEGILTMNGWKEGKHVTEEEFDSAVKKFLKL